MSETGPHKTVKFTFTAYEKISADLKLRLRNDNLTQTSFFAGLVRLYLDNDPDMMNVLYKIKQNAKVMGIKKLNKSKKDIQQGADLMERLGITKTDKENIFDMIEMDLKEYE